MVLFLSTYTNKLDRKGRVSVPASFRAALTAPSFSGVVLFRSGAHGCLEGFPYAAMEDLAARLEYYDLFSEAQDDLATTIFAEAVQIPFDGEGRIIIPEHLLKHAGLNEQAVFVGLGQKFQIWNATAYEARREQALQQVRDKGLTLPRARRPQAEDAA